MGNKQSGFSSKQKDELYKKFAPYTYDNCEKQYEKEVETYARVVDIYDGDTITCCIDENGVIVRKSIRVFEIDTCEIKNTNKDARELAYKARNRVFNLVTGQTVPDLFMKRKDMRKILNENVYLVKLKIYSVDKYGRPLSDVYAENSIDNKTISKILLDEKLAYKYGGSTKLTAEQQVDILSEKKNNI